MSNTHLIDAHAHIFFHRNPDEEKQRLLKIIDSYGIDEMYVSGLNGAFPSVDTVDDINEHVARFSVECPNVKGYVYVSPEHENALSVLERGIEDFNMIGAKIWISEYCDDHKVDALAEKLIEYKRPLLIHAFKKVGGQVAKESTAQNVRNLALRYPELKILMAHVGGNCYHGVPFVRDLKNVWVDVSGTSSRTNEVEYTVENLGEDRVIFGSDITGTSFAVPYGKVLGASISDVAREKLLYSNAKKLFDCRLGVKEALQ